MFKLIHVGKNWDGGQGKLKSSWLPARASGLTLMVNNSWAQSEMLKKLKFSLLLFCEF